MVAVWPMSTAQNSLEDGHDKTGIDKYEDTDLHMDAEGEKR